MKQPGKTRRGSSQGRKGRQREEKRQARRARESSEADFNPTGHEGELAIGDLVTGFLAHGSEQGGRGESVWLESERSDSNLRVALPIEVLRDYEKGDRLQVQVVSFDGKGGRGNLPTGRVKTLIATRDDPDRAVKGLKRAYGITGEWPAAVRQEAANLSEVSRTGFGLTLRRTDLRELPLVTIDGESARDFDDAVYCNSVAGGGWRLLVAIADVSSYVTPGSAIDREARKRSTSVYLPRHVVPMLPRALSNELCSLVPGLDRLVLAVDMQISEQGEILHYNFFEGIMHSAARLTYKRVSAFVEQSRAEGIKDAVRASLTNLHQCYAALARAREKRGALDFETSEAEFVFDGSQVTQVRASTRHTSHRMIEEAMIAANVCAASVLDEAELPLLFRVHPPPTGAKLEALLETLNVLGANLREIDLDRLSLLIRRLSENVSQNFLTTVVLRAMQQAVYSPVNQGHFGLALERYAHFTSPIRRYPDLMVHRAIKQKTGVAREAEFHFAKLQELGAHCSFQEREAESCERDVRAWYLADYARRHIGTSFRGTITSVTSFGLFVLLDQLLVEGLLHIGALGADWFEFDAVAHRLQGQSSGQHYALGDRIEVVIASVDVDRRKVELVIPNRKPSGERNGGERRYRRARRWRKT